MLVSFLVACSTPPVDSGTTPFCEVWEDADTFVVTEGGGTDGSGTLIGRMITNRSEDLHDTVYVAGVTYTLENLDIGGTPQIAESSSTGDLTHALGEGRWEIALSTTAGGYTCANSMEFDVEAGRTTEVCIDIGCQ